MSQFEKLLKRIKELDRNLRFDEVQKILESLGYTMDGPSGGSSHATFRKPGAQPITIPRQKPVKRIYIVLVKEAVEKEEERHENA